MNRAASRVAREIADFLKYKKANIYSDGRQCEGTSVSYDALERWLLLLSPPRKKRVRSPRAAKRRATVKELDALCREVVFLRDGNKCRKCGKESGLFDWAHVHSRRSRVLRWNLLNSLVLCRACHMRWHDASPGAGDAMLKWWKAEVGPEVVTKLDLLKFTKPRKTDPELVRAYLEAERKKL